LKDKEKFKSKNLFYSFKYAFEGIVYGFKNTKNLRIDLLVAILVIVFGFILKVSLIEWCILLLCIAIVISLELVNTAIENSIDLATKDINPVAKIGKDVAAGAVMFFAIFSSIIGIIIFLPKIIDLF
jgi:diacylglycerol kinase